MTSPFTIAPKDKRILKSPEARDWYKHVNAILELKMQEIIDQANKQFIESLKFGYSENKL